MPEPIKFKHLIAEMAGGREAIMMVARAQNQAALAGGAHPTTKALAVEHILEAIRMQLKEPLVKMFTEHVNAASDEYELMEGTVEEAADQKAWWEGEKLAVAAALGGETLELVGAVALTDWNEKGESVEDLVDLILANIKDPANALAKCGITKEDVASLIAPAPIEEPPGVAGVDHPEEPTATEPKATRKRQPKIDGPSPVTTAAAAALTALIDHSAYKEADVAAALGVSRTQALNYRTGKTLWEPSDEQMAALDALFEQALDKLRNPLSALHMAGLE